MLPLSTDEKTLDSGRVLPEQPCMGLGSMTVRTGIVSIRRGLVLNPRESTEDSRFWHIRPFAKMYQI